ncbi:MAG: pyridoxal phosphate-dependent aminotransferase [Candidatus Bathyarchaeia archaeon]
MASSGRLGDITESVIREMTRLSERYGAINLSQGMPDFDPPQELIEAGINAIKNGHNQYPITWGQKSLRDAIARKVKEYNKIEVDPDKNVTVTCGASEAVTSTIFGITNPGDTVVVTDPFYENYVPDAILAGAKLTYVPFKGQNLHLDDELLKTVLEEKPKLIMLNTPNNPTGKILDTGSLKLIADLCEEYGTIAVVDEIYEHIIYDGKEHVSLASIGNMRDQTVTVSGASKTYSVTGWRVGWAVAEENLSNSIRKIHDYLTIGAPTPFQEALVTALNFPAKYYDQLAKMYEEKRNQMLKILDEAEIAYYRPEGAYYILAEAPTEFNDGLEYANYLIKNVGVAVLPASALYHDKELGKRKIRFAYCKKDETLQEVGKRIKKLKPHQY